MAVIIIAILITLIPESIFLFFADVFIIIGVIIALIILATFLFATITTLVSLINLAGSIGAAYNYLVYPA